MPLTEPFQRKIYAPLGILIVVYDLRTDTEVRRHRMNYNDPKKRKWLQKLCVWAWNNNHSVETFNVTDETLAETDA